MSTSGESVSRTMTPFGDTVVLEMLPDQDYSSKIVLPQGARVNYARAKRARVVDVGPAVTEGALYAGAEVLVAPRYDGLEINVPGLGKYHILSSRAIVAVLSDKRPADAIRAEIFRLHAELGC